MNTHDTIYSRKSIRSFTGDPVSDATLNEILKAAKAAPVGMGQFENVHLTVITNKELLGKINTAGAALFGNPKAVPLYGAPQFILVSVKKPAPGRENGSYSNAAGIVENMALAATDLGAGACHIWGAVMALSHQPDLVTALELPEGFIPACGLVVGETSDSYSVRNVDTGKIGVNYLK